MAEEPSRKERIKHAVLQEAGEAFVGIENNTAKNPFRKKGNWPRFTLAEGIVFRAGFDFKKFWIILDEVPEGFPTTNFLNDEEKGVEGFSAPDIDEFKKAVKTIAVYADGWD